MYKHLCCILEICTFSINENVIQSLIYSACNLNEEHANDPIFFACLCRWCKIKGTRLMTASAHEAWRNNLIDQQISDKEPLTKHFVFKLSITSILWKSILETSFALLYFCVHPSQLFFATAQHYISSSPLLPRITHLPHLRHPAPWHNPLTLGCCTHYDPPPIMYPRRSGVNKITRLQKRKTISAAADLSLSLGFPLLAKLGSPMLWLLTQRDAASLMQTMQPQARAS